MVFFEVCDVIAWAGLIITEVLDGEATATGAVSKVLTVLPIGGTVAMGSACVLDNALTIGGTATVGSTCVRVPASTGCMTGTCFLIDRFAGPCCTNSG